MTQAGRIVVVCGPMFAGKTTALLDRLAAAEASGRRVVAIKPTGDTRSGSCLAAHSGERRPAIDIASSAALPPAAGDAEMVGIDEVHFFDPTIAIACGSLRASGRDVLAAGVDLDQYGEIFPAIRALEVLADEVIRLTSTCARCGGVATFTQRLVASGAMIVVGGVGDYEPRCRRCFQPARMPEPER